ncbi:3-deoxy-manno-octulosonate cytidylyltransferase [Oecophyllibacter saccharovorans]|uniref:3-deoxy-manno-octulosonate cytidylyltransferase n=1 Tax=Oecophyllibacter saccharovorans TaxID=2558360 RepID=A0A506UQH6_9PROT|nr:3-deoxy-manno-octulosonate cytidylyltransferase [Oecophyllibacter saccharovorans]TPW35532.1 3-deoxy-manno-octulosonate cytidylyltransferase [Oecophyllibacter saccharovorans]
MRPVVVIPARLASTRLPRKPLADIGGQPMIAHVARRARVAGLGPVVVAADSVEILAAIEDLQGVTGILTPPDLQSGSDRVAAALKHFDPAGVHDVVVNLQGDLPLVEPDSVARALLPLQDPRIDLGTLVTQVRSPAEAQTDSVVKAVCAFPAEGEAGGPEDRQTARALYFSRQPVPWGPGPLWHHVGIYAWRRQALEKFVQLPPGLLEQRESLEQLRALEAGMAIGCAWIARSFPGVDTPGDLARVRKLVQEGNLAEAEEVGWPS